MIVTDQWLHRGWCFAVKLNKMGGVYHTHPKEIAC